MREFLSLDNPKNAPVQDDDIDDTTDDKVDELVRVFSYVLTFMRVLENARYRF